MQAMKVPFKKIQKANLSSELRSLLHAHTRTQNTQNNNAATGINASKNHNNEQYSTQLGNYYNSNIFT